MIGRERFLGEYVKACACNGTFFEGIDERIFIDNRCTGDIDEESCLWYDSTRKTE
ncbi:hypothetical protein [Dialister hominis]|uniref:hypothetical protein n=1 Tax=Dialister hominis TaxID=2582419 RepID=UPI003FED58D7